MPTFAHRSYQNQLLRHLLRHNQVTTLFRFVTPESSMRSLTRADITATIPPGQIIQASLATHPFEPPKGKIGTDESTSVVSTNQQVNKAQPYAISINGSGVNKISGDNQPALQKPSSREGEIIPELDSPAWQRLDAIYTDQQDLLEREQQGQDSENSISEPNDQPFSQHQERQSPSRGKQLIAGRLEAAQESPVPPIQRAAATPGPNMATPVYQPLPQARPSATPTPESSITDDVWHRLQAIYDAHQEQEQRARALVQDRIQRAATTRTAQSALEEHTSAGQSPDERIAAEPVTKPDGKSVVDTTKSTASSSQLVQEVEDKSAPAEKSQSVQMSSSETIIDHPLNPLQRAWQQVGHFFGNQTKEEQISPKLVLEQGDRSFPDTPENDHSTENITAVAPISQPLQPGSQPGLINYPYQFSGIKQLIQNQQEEESNTDMETIADGLPQQSIPLQAVWTVEQRENLPPESAYKTEEAPEVSSSTRSELPLGQSQEIHRILQNVEPRQQTDSHIEVINPRHRRPFAAPIIQAMPAEPAESEQNKRPVDLLQTRPEQDALSHEKGGGSQTAATPNPELKKLWDLVDDIHLGDTGLKTAEGEVVHQTAVPISVGNQGIYPIQPADETDLRSHLKSPEVSFPTPISVEPIGVSPAREPGVVQKQEANPNPTDQPMTSGSAAGEKQGKPDINELARQVYSEVRRRIALEWERKRF
jgi:hypothetical protein